MLGRQVIYSAVMALICFAQSQVVMAGSYARTIWKQGLMIQDHIPQRGGSTQALLGFSLHRGEFTLEVDPEHRKVVSFSGVFRDLSHQNYTLLKTYFDHKYSPMGVRNVAVKKVTYANDGYKDLVFHLDLDILSIPLSSETYWALMNSERINVELKLKRISKTSLGLFVGLDFEQQGRERHRLALVNWKRI